MSKEELGSLVKKAVEDAMKVPATELECPDCHAKFDRVPTYLDHRVSEYMDKSLEGLTAQIEGFKVPTAENLVLECKDGICKMVEEHVEATFNVTKKGEAPAPVEPEDEPGLFDHHEVEIKAAEAEAE